MPSDLQVVQAVIAGESGAFSQFRSRVDKIVGRCLEDVIKDAPWARSHKEDLRQGVYLMLLENDAKALKSFEARAKLTTWVHVVARRHIRRKAASLRPLQVADQHRLETAADSADLPDTVGIRRDLITQTRAGVSQLEDQEQLLLALLYEQGLNATEAAAAMGMKPSGVRMKKARLLKKLGEVLHNLR